jgi:hypothetical protein
VLNGTEGNQKQETRKTALTRRAFQRKPPAQPKFSSMREKSASQSGFFNLRVLIGLFVVLAGVSLAVFATSGGGLGFGSTTLGSVQIKEPERPINPRSPWGGVQEEWVARYNGGHGFDIAYALSLDGSGNVYITGFSVGPGSCNFVCNDYATIKYNNSGTQEWVARYNGPANDDDHASAIAVDASGNVYVTGASIGTTWPDYDYATIKYDASGNQVWVARYNGPGNEFDFANAITVDASGDVYVTGASRGSGTGFDYATVKYDNFGQQQWVARYNGPGNDDDEAYGIAVDASGNVYVTGYSTGSGTGLYDYATIKYDASGNQLWAARYNGPANGSDVATAIGVDASGEAHVTGFSDGSGTGFDYATVKYDTSGQEQWVARYNGPANDEEEAHAIAVDASSNVYVTGHSVGSGTQEDYATIKYNASGTEEWVTRYNGQANLNDHATAIAVDASGNVYVTGWSVGLGPFGTSYDYATVKYDGSGQEQWVARYDGPGDLDDQAYAVAVDSAANVYVTGYSIDSDGVSDYTTIKYSQSTPTPTPTPTPTLTPTPTATPTPTPTPVQITLHARGYKVHGLQTVDLFWSGPTSGYIDIYRNGALIATVPNQGGFYTDNINRNGRGTYTYRVCVAGTGNCSNQVTVTFGGGG